MTNTKTVQLTHSVPISNSNSFKTDPLTHSIPISNSKTYQNNSNNPNTNKHQAPNKQFHSKLPTQFKFIQNQFIQTIPNTSK